MAVDEVFELELELDDPEDLDELELELDDPEDLDELELELLLSSSSSSSSLLLESFESFTVHLSEATEVSS